MPVGIDEVGRGPWAGPLVAAAVCMPAEVSLDGLTDSKQLTARSRVSLFRSIQQQAETIGIGWVSPAFVDRYGLTASTRTAMYSAWRQVSLSHTDRPVLIDGATPYLLEELPSSRCIPKGDQQEPAIAAASIIAKVLRDRFMHIHARLFPEYGFDAHVGYGTNQHREALQTYGTCSLHRHSFTPVKNVNSK